MEAVTFLLDAIALVALIYMGFRDDRRPSGTPQTSLLRMAEPPAAKAPVEPGSGWRDRAARSGQR